MPHKLLRELKWQLLVFNVDTRSQEQHKFGEIFHINKQINFPL